MTHIYFSVSKFFITCLIHCSKRFLWSTSKTQLSRTIHKEPEVSVSRTLYLGFFLSNSRLGALKRVMRFLPSREIVGRIKRFNNVDYLAGEERRMKTMLVGVAPSFAFERVRPDLHLRRARFNVEFVRFAHWTIYLF